MWLFSFEILADLQEVALPEYFYEEYWTIQKRLSCALAAILGGSLGVLWAKKCRPFDFIFRRLDKHLEKKEKLKNYFGIDFLITIKEHPIQEEELSETRAQSFDFRRDSKIKSCPGVDKRGEGQFT